MSGPGRSNLQVNLRGQDLNWYKRSYNPFSYEPYLGATNHISEIFDINPVSVGYTWGGEVDFELDKRGDLLGKIELMINRGPIVNGSSSAYINDWEVYSMIDRVNFKYNNRLFWTVTGDELYIQLQQRKRLVERESEGYLQNGVSGTGIGPNNTGANSISLSSISSQGTVIAGDLQVPWADRHKHIPMVAMPNKIRVEVFLKAQQFFINDQNNPNASNDSVALNQIWLRCYYVQLPQHLRSEVFTLVNYSEVTTTGQTAIEQRGVAVKILSTESQLKNIYTGSLNYMNINLRNIKNSVVYFAVLMRDQNDLITPWAVNLWNFQPISRMYLVDNGNRITDYYDWFVSSTSNVNQYNHFTTNALAFPDGNLWMNVPILPLVEPEFILPSESNCFGSRFIAEYNNPQLYFETTNAPGNTVYQVDIIAYIHNLLIYQNGDIRIWLQ